LIQQFEHLTRFYIHATFEAKRFRKFEHSLRHKLKRANVERLESGNNKEFRSHGGEFFDGKEKSEQ